MPRRAHCRRPSRARRRLRPAPRNGNGGGSGTSGGSGKKGAAGSWRKVWLKRIPWILGGLFLFGLAAIGVAFAAIQARVVPI